MGVPSLFRWLALKFPGVVRKPDPSHDVCDNLYVDANSIIHNVCHPSHRPPPSTEEQMMVEIGAYLEHVIKTANPLKLVFIAIDGVAPQAKILQQRARRFRASREAAEIQVKKAAFLKAAREQRIFRYDKLASADDWDSNVITPGTPFMAALDKWLHAWILRKFKTDPQFQPLTIILSGSGVPGEGEHKAMDFIRRQRCEPGYNPLKHAFYGPDADLILLALATHEPCFRILREDPRQKFDMRCILCQGYEHFYKKCMAVPEDWTMPNVKDNQDFSPPQLIFFDVWLLRLALEQYLKLPEAIETKTENGKKEFDLKNIFNLERAIDDFILLVSLMGNDFVPGLPIPEWEINEGAINKVVDAWKKSTLNQKGYIVKNGELRLDRLRNLFKQLAAFEGFPAEAQDDSARYPSISTKKDSATPDPRSSSVSNSVRRPESHMFTQLSKTTTLPSHTNGSSKLPDGFPGMAPDPALKKDDQTPGPDNPFQDFQEDDAPVEHYELFPTKAAYYEKKLGAVHGRNPRTIRDMVEKYVQGLQWVMSYYCQGCPDWKWYYPYHYAPWPSDTHGISSLETHFDQSSPLPPFSQLMSVFPPASAEHVPGPYRHLMLEPNSALKDYYPEKFELDRNNKKQEWKSVVLLAHIDPRRLQNTLQPIWDQKSLWSASERARNRPDVARILVCDQGDTKPLYQKIVGLRDPRRKDQRSELAYSETGYLSGSILPDLKLEEAEAFNKDFDTSDQAARIRAISSIYLPPKQRKPHTCELLPNQPKVHFTYKLIARMKRDPLKSFHREWQKGDNVGRDARAVAEELAEERRTGIKPKFSDWRANIVMDEDEEEHKFEPLPNGFDDYLIPVFPDEQVGLFNMGSIILDEDEEDGNPELTTQYDSDASAATVSQSTFNRSRVVPNGAKRPLQPPSQAPPRYTEAGYLKAETRPKVESDIDESSESEGEQRRKKAMFKKSKGKGRARPPSQVKREPSDDDMDWGR